MTIERNEKLEDSLLEKMSSVDLKKTDNWNKAMILNSAAKVYFATKNEKFGEFLVKGIDKCCDCGIEEGLRMLTEKHVFARHMQVRYSI